MVIYTRYVEEQNNFFAKVWGIVLGLACMFFTHSYLHLSVISPACFELYSSMSLRYLQDGLFVRDIFTINLIPCANITSLALLANLSCSKEKRQGNVFTEHF